MVLPATGTRIGRLAARKFGASTEKNFPYGRLPQLARTGHSLRRRDMSATGYEADSMCSRRAFPGWADFVAKVGFEVVLSASADF
jgi:hypothetical protein